ncbi:MAG: GAF domain-containing protein [Betaproteobacteria bacterium]|nr:GAF domain-containing protein [Betaproteobacteria bacterium]
MDEYFPTRSSERMNSIRLQQARRRFFSEGESGGNLLSETVLRSWDRCRAAGLQPASRHAGCDGMSAAQLTEHRERNRHLLAQARSVMEYVYEQIRHCGSMVILADRQGTVLHSLGDAEFVDRASRVALAPGASWREERRGTNAIGTTLVEARPVEIFGAEHFLDRNTFLTCSASPLFDPRGEVVGVLDISGDHRAYQSHTLGLVGMAAQMVEKRLFENLPGEALRVAFHPHQEFLGGPGEGLLALSPEGRILAVNAAGLRLLGAAANAVIDGPSTLLFDLPLGALFDLLRRAPQASCQLRARNGQHYFLRRFGEWPAFSSVPVRVFDTAMMENGVAPVGPPALDGSGALAAEAVRGTSAALFDQVRELLGTEAARLFDPDPGAAAGGRAPEPSGQFGELRRVLRQALALLEPEPGAAFGQRGLADAADPAARLRDIERGAAQQALKAAGGNISAAARALGISRNKLYRLLPGTPPNRAMAAGSSTASATSATAPAASNSSAVPKP